MVSRLRIFVVCLLVSMTAGRASAYHTADDRMTDFSAYTLRKKQFRLGLFQQEYGIFNWWTVGTYTLPWLVSPVAKSFNMDLYTKFKFVDTGSWAASGRVGAFYFQYRDLKTGDLDDGDFNATILPIELSLSHVFSQRWTGSFQATWVQTFVGARADTVDENTTLGAGALSNLQFALNAEFRLSPVVAFYLVTRYLPFATPARINSDAEVDSGTSATIELQVSPEEIRHSWLVQPGVTFSWKLVNLQFGLGYGDLWVPGVRLVAVRKFIVPDFDLFFRF